MHHFIMKLIDKYPDIHEAIQYSKLLSNGQKKIINSLIQFEHGAPMDVLMDLMNASKQALYFNVKKLLDRGFINRKKTLVYVYQINEEKLEEIIVTYKQYKLAKSKK